MHGGRMQINTLHISKSKIWQSNLNDKNLLESTKNRLFGNKSWRTAKIDFLVKHEKFF